MPAPHPPTFEKMRRLRQKRGWTQADLAERAQVDQATISSLELGRIKNPTIDTIRRVAAALDVDLDDLYPPSGNRMAARAR
jgi:transcriptional regulator with XRE-family HTH domain